MRTKPTRLEAWAIFISMLVIAFFAGVLYERKTSGPHSVVTNVKINNLKEWDAYLENEERANAGR